MPDPTQPQLAVSHEQNNNELTPDEIRALNKHYASQPIGQSTFPFEKLSPVEKAMYLRVQQEDADARKGLDATSGRKDSVLAGGVPFINHINPEDPLIGGQLLSSGKNLLSHVSHGVADNLAKGSGFWSGVGGGLQGLLKALESNGPEIAGESGSAGTEGASGVMRKAPPPLFTDTAPMSDADYLSQTGHARGSADPASLRLKRPSVAQPPDLSPETIEKMKVGGEGGWREPYLSPETKAGITRPPPPNQVLEPRPGAAKLLMKPTGPTPSPMGNSAFESSEKATQDLMNGGMEDGDFKQQLIDSLKLRRRKP